MQLAHAGRKASVTQPWKGDKSIPVSEGGWETLAPSAVPFSEDRETPAALTQEEIKRIVGDFRAAAQRALAAGFKVIEIHGAHGYLVNEFMSPLSNKRTDEYGGSIENRARLMLEVTDAVISVWGASRVGMHLAPRCDAQSMGDSNPLSTFSYVARELGKRKIAFICAREHLGKDSIGPQLKKAFGGMYFVNEGFSKETAEQALAKGVADAVVFGRLFLANPDLPKRFHLNAPLNKPHPETFYGQGPEGYTDYPSLESKAA